MKSDPRMPFPPLPPSGHPHPPHPLPPFPSGMFPPGKDGVPSFPPPEVRRALERGLIPLPPPGFVRDVVSEVLESIQLRSMVVRLSVVTEPWGIEWPSGPSGFFIIKEGRAWLEVEGGEGGSWLEAGDLVIINRGMGHRLTHQPGQKTVHVFSLLTPEIFHKRGGLRHGGGGAPTSFICGGLIFEHRGFNPLTSGLPHVLHVKGGPAGPKPWVRGVLDLIELEQREDQPGGHTVLSRLAEVMYVNAVREHIAEVSAAGMGARAPVGWLRALLSQDIGPALGAMHMRPDIDWTVESLADHVQMSRSVFAKRFADDIGMTPVRYLTECRMRKATGLLRTSPMGVKEVASAVGYGSEAAFGNAFKRWAGVAPGAYRSEHSGAGPEGSGDEGEHESESAAPLRSSE